MDDPIERYANLATTTLSGDVASGSSTISVATSGDPPFTFPTSGQFRVRIDNELLLVTSVSGLTWGVSRGVESTVASGHTSGVVVNHVLTAGGLTGVGGSIILSDTYENRPTTGAAGQVYFSTNGTTVDRSNGSSWNGWGPIFPITPPVSGNFSWVNQGTATLSSAGSSLFISAPIASGDNVRMLVKAIPTGSYTVTMAFLPQVVFPANFNACGMVLRESTFGKLVSFHIVSDSIQNSSQQTIAAIKWNGPTSFNASYIINPRLGSANGPPVPPWQMGPCMWFQIKDDTVNRIFKVSNDGYNFFQVFSVSRTDFLTPNQIGFFANPNSSSYPVGITVLSWAETSP